MFGLGVCRACGADYRPRDEDDDLCYECQVAPRVEEYPEPSYAATCLNCGQRDELDGPPYGSYFCCYECSKAGSQAVSEVTFA